MDETDGKKAKGVFFFSFLFFVFLILLAYTPSHLTIRFRFLVGCFFPVW